MLSRGATARGRPPIAIRPCSTGSWPNGKERSDDSLATSDLRALPTHVHEAFGGRGAANLAGVESQNIVALCDVDDRRVGKAYEQFPEARKFADFRKMFDQLEQQIDGVVISTPDPQPEVLPVPAGLDWDLWLAPTRPYTKGFAPYDWRFWWEFGTGEAGNWGCHILDLPFWALELGHATHCAASGPRPDADRTPKEFSSRMQFPARTGANGRTLPPVRLHWSQGLPTVLTEGGIAPKLIKDRNTLFIGSDGMLLCGFDWDAAAMKSSRDDVNGMLRRDYRKGWEA